MTLPSPIKGELDWFRSDDPPGAFQISADGRQLAEFEWERPSRSCRICFAFGDVWRATFSGFVPWIVELGDVDTREPALIYAGTPFRGLAEFPDGTRVSYLAWLTRRLRPKNHFLFAEGERILSFRYHKEKPLTATAIIVEEGWRDGDIAWPLLMLWGSLAFQLRRSVVSWTVGPWLPDRVPARAINRTRARLALSSDSRWFRPSRMLK